LFMSGNAVHCALKSPQFFALIAKHAAPSRSRPEKFIFLTNRWKAKPSHTAYAGSKKQIHRKGIETQVGQTSTQVNFKYTFHHNSENNVEQIFPCMPKF
jgi:hypothetical protein